MVRTPARDPLPVRLRAIRDGMSELLERHRPDVVAVEDVFYGKNLRTTVVLAHARGVILLTAEEAGVPIAEYPPALVKKAVVGRGGAAKPQVGYMVAQLLRLTAPPSPADAADGVAVALAHHILLGSPERAGGGQAAGVIGGVRGKLERVDIDVATIETAGGVVYEVLVPLGVLGRLPAPGGSVHLFTELVVREDAWLLFGFDSAHERVVFRRLLTASGFGPRLALAVLSTLGPDRAVRAILHNDLAALGSVLGHREEEGGAARARAAGPLQGPAGVVGAGGGAAGPGVGQRPDRAGLSGVRRGGGRPRRAGRRGHGRYVTHRAAGAAAPDRRQGRKFRMTVTARTAEWDCTRCGSTNRKLVPSTRDEATDRCVTCHAQAPDRAGRHHRALARPGQLTPRADDMAQRLEVTTPDALPEETGAEAALRPSRLDEFVGQEQVKASLQIAIDAARGRGETLDHTLFFGPPGLGKTTLAMLMAREMGVQLRTTSGPVLEKPGDLVGLLTTLGPGDILFIDEIHRLRPVLEEFLYPAMEDFRVDVRIADGPNAQTIPMTLERFTLIGATTRFGLLTPPMRARFGMVERLNFYPPEDLERIVTRSAAHPAACRWRRRARSRSPSGAAARRGWPTGCCAGCGTTRRCGPTGRSPARWRATRSRGSTWTSSGSTTWTPGSSPPSSRSSAAARSGSAPWRSRSARTAARCEEVYEPYLIQQGFLERTPRGRCATALAYRRFGITPPPRPGHDL